MTTPTTARTSDAGALPTITPARRFTQARALAIGELRLLGRNKVALINTLLMPGLLVLFFANLPVAENLGFGVVAPIFILGMALVFVVYYTLVTALVARREAYVLQRLRTGEASDATILAGLSMPFALITAAQTVLCVLGAALFLGVGMPTNLALIAVAIVLGSLVWTLLGIASTAITRSVEHAQITTMPLIFVPLLFSGISFPLALLPEWGRLLASLTPLHPVVSLMRLGMAGIDVDGRSLTVGETFTHALPPTLVLIAWTVLGVWLVRRHLRWEPRR
ncbi:ABC transporter permease [Mobilicoccus massiliensis]|uniref:ABC transporter permease n=1 Tax=Mobilicoccus massiliensis TaxID=1522310 RepID=UPI00058E2A85|nr:ABC transporter permease [Mobilicoccus massiliensis]